MCRTGVLNSELHKTDQFDRNTNRCNGHICHLFPSYKNLQQDDVNVNCRDICAQTVSGKNAEVLIATNDVYTDTVSLTLNMSILSEVNYTELYPVHLTKITSLNIFDFNARYR